MSHSSQLFEKQPISVQNLNGFDKSHLVIGSAKTGQLVPVLFDLLMPKSIVDLGVVLNCELPPLASNFFGRIDAVVEVFECKLSILYGGFKQFISNQIATMFPSSQDSIVESGGYALPVVFTSSSSAVLNKIISLDTANNGLLDYLGGSLSGFEGQVLGPTLSLLPFLCYHRVWDCFYRNPSVTKTIFAVNPNVGFKAEGSISVSPSTDPQYFLSRKNVSYVWHSFYTTPAVGREGFTVESTSAVFTTLDELTFPDGVTVFETRQRCYSRDYFVAASTSPQQGAAPRLVMEVNDDDEASFDVAQLRSLVSLKHFLEVNNYDPTYRGAMRNHFDVNPSDAALDEPSYIGRVVVPVYQKSVFQSVQGSGAEGSSNPFAAAGSLGAKGASGSMNGQGEICHRYKTSAFSYLIGLFSLVPHAMYGYGFNRILMQREIGDFPFPEFQGVGMDAIKNYEVMNTGDYDSDFAYIGRYSWMKYICDRTHGELRPGRTLESFVLQRYYSSAPEFGTEFVTISQDALDGVLAVDTATSKLSCWFEIYWVYKVVMPLAQFCVPTLGDMKDTHTVYTTQGGSRL